MQKIKQYTAKLIFDIAKDSDIYQYVQDFSNIFYFHGFQIFYGPDWKNALKDCLIHSETKFTGMIYF